jgi:hypothetical protein
MAVGHLAVAHQIEAGGGEQPLDALDLETHGLFILTVNERR